MAASLYARGHSVLADDLVVLDPKDDGSVMLFPTFPELKLFPESLVAALGDNPDGLPKLVSGLDKRARSAPNGFSTDPIPLKAIYLPENDPVLRLELISPRERITHLIRESYGARIFSHWLKGEKASAHLRRCAEVANRVPIYWLKRPRDLDSLGDAAKLVEDNVRSLTDELVMDSSR